MISKKGGRKVKYEFELKRATKRYIENNKLEEVKNGINVRIYTLVVELLLKNEDIKTNILMYTLNNAFSLEDIVKFRKKFFKEIIGDTDEKDFGIDQILKIQKHLGINTIERKHIFLERTRELTDLFLQGCNGDKEKYLEFKEKYEEYIFNKTFDTENYTLKKYLPFSILNLLIINNDLGLNDRTIETLRKIKLEDVKYYIAILKKELDFQFDMKKRRRFSKLDEIKKLTVSTPLTLQNNLSSVTLETLKLENEQLKSSLNLCERNFEKTLETMEDEVNNAISDRLKDFFIALNSAQYGNFLDKMPLIEETLKNIRKNKEQKPSQDINRILISVKNIIKFLKDQGITPIREVNSIFEGDADDIDEMDYIGDEFIGEETKLLKIVSPGYRYEDIVISIPKVEEVKE